MYLCVRDVQQIVQLYFLKLHRPVSSQRAEENNERKIYPFFGKSFKKKIMLIINSKVIISLLHPYHRIHAFIIKLSLAFQSIEP